MKGARGLVWWVGRLVLRPAGGTASTVATVVVVALLTMLMCATAAGSLAMDRQTERGDSITPVLSYDREISESTLLTLDPSLSAQRRWNGEEVLRTYFAAAPDGPVAPGLAEMPAAGEYYASPELARAMKDDATLGALFASLRQVGVISQEGLVDPTELRAVVGIERETPLLVPVDRFGSTQALGSEAMRDDARLDGAVTGIVTALIWLPGIVLLVIAVRLGARTRDRRAHAMHVLGLTTRQVRVVHALAAGVPSTFAALLGVAVFVMLTGTLDRIPFTRIGFTDADVQLPWWAMAGCTVALAASVLAIVAGTVDPSPNDPPVRARTSVRFGPVTKLGIAFIGVGAGLLVAMRVLVAIFGPFVAIGLWIACFLVAAGLAASGPALIARLFGYWAPRVWPGARLVGFRLASHASATSLRLGGLLAVLVVLLLGNQAFMSVLNGGTSWSWSERLDGVTAVPATLADLTGSLNLAAVDEAVPELSLIHI